MSDHLFDSAPPDLELVANLIDGSSLGCQEAFKAQNDVPLDVVMRLRGRARQDVPDRHWDSLPESVSVLTWVMGVVPNFDGSFPFDSSIPVDGKILALNRGGQCLELEPPRYCLPGGAHRQEWNVFIVEADQACRCKLEWLRPEGRIEAAIWWELVEPEKAAQHHLKDISSQLLPLAAQHLGYGVRDVPDTVGKQVLFENALSHILRERGISAECAVRIVWHEPSDHGTQTPSIDPDLVRHRIDNVIQASTVQSSVPPVRGEVDLYQEVTHVIEVMKLLHLEGGVEYSREYFALLRDAIEEGGRGFDPTQEDPGFHSDPLVSYLHDLMGAAYWLTLVDEALRVLGMQVDEARQQTLHFVQKFGRDVGELLVISCKGFRPGGRPDLPGVTAALTQLVLAGAEGTAAYGRERLPYRRLQTGDETRPPVLGDIEARRQERYEYDGQLA